MGEVQLIPGTALPIVTPGMAPQPEGRGDVVIATERQPPSLIDPNAPDPTLLAEGYRQMVDAAIRAYDRAPKRDREYFQGTAGQTDGTTGNLLLELFECPQGKQGRIVLVTVDAPNSATITPSAPLASASIWTFLAVLGTSSGIANTGPAASRAGMVAFAPTSAAGPVIPGQWTFNEDEAPIIWGGQMLYFIMVGGSVAAATNLLVECSYRINLYSQ